MNLPAAARAAAPVAVCLLLAAGARPAGADPAATPEVLLDRLDQAWRAKDVAAYLELWSFPTAAAREEERAFVLERLASEECDLELQRPQTAPGAPVPSRVKISAQAFSIAESITS